MPTTTATITLNSDIDASPLNISNTTTLYNADLDTGVEHTTGMNRKIWKTEDTGPIQLISTIIGGTFTLKAVTMASGDATVTHEATTLVKVGQPVFGLGVPSDTYVATAADGSITTFELDINADAAVETANGSINIGYNNYTPNKANKVYIRNSSTSDTDYIVITINSEDIGRLYAGDWMLMPWSAVNPLSNIFVTAAVQTSTVIIDYMVIGEGDS